MDEIFHLPAVELAARIREGTLSPVDLVEACIDRIERVNPALNAVVVTRFDEARAEAQEAARTLQTIKASELPPLFGVPCTIKEFAALEGFPHTGGILARKHVVADRTATTVQRLRAAGAIVLGLTNAPEGGLWHETHNRIYGRTNNPWDLDRTPGGSSGGEAAIIAAGGSPFGLGSDTGGSVRIPAAFCGIYAHKPTGRLIPSTGHFPPGPGTPDVVPMAFGPMTRSARDLMPLTRIMAGPDGEDEWVESMQLGDPEAVDWSKMSVFPVPDNGRSRPRPAVRRAVDRAARWLADRGARVKPLRSKRLAQGFEMWASILSEDSLTYEELVGRDGRVNRFREVVRYALGRSAHTGPVLFMVIVEKLLKRLPNTTKKYVQLAIDLRKELEDVLGDDGILIHPTYTRSAPRHRAIAMSLFDPAHTAVFNILEFPATQAPLGLDERGLPIGLQLVGSRGADHLTIAGAMALEAAQPNWRAVDPRRSDPRLKLV